ncbi:hypothetical protein LIA77_06080 [Sarocladium implicatum]|nr:hypothetical protein LIA77_06080 [Sarocladium implicatum]
MLANSCIASEQPPLEFVLPQNLGHHIDICSPISSSLLKSLIFSWIIHQGPNTPHLRRLLPFTDRSRLPRPLRKHPRSRKISIRNRDLESIPVHACLGSTWVVPVLGPQDLEKQVAIVQCGERVAGVQLGETLVEALDREVSSVTRNLLLRRQCADLTSTAELQRLQQRSDTVSRWSAHPVRDCQFLPLLHRSDRVHRPDLLHAVPCATAVWSAAVVQKTDCVVDCADICVAPAREGTGCHDAAKRILACPFVVERQVLSLFLLGEVLDGDARVGIESREG